MRLYAPGGKTKWSEQTLSTDTGREVAEALYGRDLVTKNLPKTKDTNDPLWNIKFNGGKLLLKLKSS